MAESARAALETGPFADHANNCKQSPMKGSGAERERLYSLCGIIKL